MNDLIPWEIVIPQHVQGCREINAVTKDIYGYIRGLTKKEGYCWESNKTLGKLVFRSKDVATRAIRDLIKLGFIIAYYKRDEGICIRRLYLQEALITSHSELEEGGWFLTEKETRMSRT